MASVLHDSTAAALGPQHAAPLYDTNSKPTTDSSEACLYPHDLLESPPDGLDGRRWWALYTKARHEKAVAGLLLGMRVPFYLPLIRKTSLSRGRTIRTAEIPLFGSYVFLYGTDEERVLALTTNRVSRTLEVEDSMQMQMQRDLRQVQTLIASDVPLTVEQRISPGQHVRVKSGPFGGLEGVVIRRKQQSLLLVYVHYMGQGVSVEIDDFLLEPCTQPDHSSAKGQPFTWRDAVSTF